MFVLISFRGRQQGVFFDVSLRINNWENDVLFFFLSRILVSMVLCGRFGEEVVAYVALVSGPSLRKDLAVQDVGTTILVSK